MHSGSVLLKYKTRHAEHYCTMLPAKYREWMTSTGRPRVVGDVGFQLPHDVHFADLVPTMHSWIVDYLSFWNFSRFRTGLMTSHERVDALLAFACHHFSRNNSSG